MHVKIFLNQVRRMYLIKYKQALVVFNETLFPQYGLSADMG